jgi:hypothetical protein
MLTGSSSCLPDSFFVGTDGDRSRDYAANVVGLTDIAALHPSWLTVGDAGEVAGGRVRTRTGVAT